MKLKNNLDEMQEQKLKQIEHTGFWLFFWGIFLAMMIQIAFFSGKNIWLAAGEFAVFAGQRLGGRAVPAQRHLGPAVEVRSQDQSAGLSGRRSSGRRLLRHPRLPQFRLPARGLSHFCHNLPVHRFGVLRHAQPVRFLL